MTIHATRPVLRVGPEASEGRPTCILLHGRNRSAKEMIEVAERLDVPEVSFVAPTADDHSWYPKGFMAPFEDNEPYYSAALDRVAQLVAEAESNGIKKDRIAICGFSQGACLAADFAYRNPLRWGAVIVFTGGLIAPEGELFDTAGQLRGTPVFMGTADQDSWVPLDRFHETARVLEAMGADMDTLVYPGSEHGVSDEEIARARALLRKLADA